LFGTYVSRFYGVFVRRVKLETSPCVSVSDPFGKQITMRAIWSGAISFGLVSVPVRMYSATESKELRFHFLHKDDLQPIGYDKVRKDTGKSVDPDDVVRGFEIEKGRYVPIEDEDLDRLDIELTHSIDICDFVDLDEIDRSTTARRTTSFRRPGRRSRIACSCARSTRPRRS